MDTSPKSNDQQKTQPPEHEEALSGWGAIIGAAIGIVIGLFFDKAIFLGTVIGVTGWLGGAIVDRSRR
jgi:uncharacterized membrane protein